MFSDRVGAIIFFACIIFCIGFPGWLEGILCAIH